MDSRSSRLILLGVGSLLFFEAVFFPVRADIYRFVDENGVARFSNVPTTPGYSVYIREKTPEATAEKEAFPYEAYLLEAAGRHGVSLELLKAIIKVESDFNPWAVSRKGAQGLMQIMPENFPLLDLKDPFDPKENILAGTKFFRILLDRFSGNITLALAAYNAGPEMVAKHRGVPPFPETEAYVQKVLRYYRRFLES